MARAMITRYGMSEHFGMVALETVNNQYLGGDASLACANDTASMIDQEVIELVSHQYQKAYDILNQYQKALHKLAEFLYVEETITGEQFMSILQENMN